MRPGYEDILTDEAVNFVAALTSTFRARRDELLAHRVERQRQIDAGHMPDFLPETAHIRQGDWQIAPLPADLQDRRVEITGPTDRKMVINALNSGAKVFMLTLKTPTRPPGTTSSRARSICAMPSAAPSASPTKRAKSISSMIRQQC